MLWSTCCHCAFLFCWYLCMDTISLVTLEKRRRAYLFLTHSLSILLYANLEMLLNITRKQAWLLLLLTHLHQGEHICLISQKTEHLQPRCLQFMSDLSVPSFSITFVTGFDRNLWKTDSFPMPANKDKTTATLILAPPNKNYEWCSLLFASSDMPLK